MLEQPQPLDGIEQLGVLPVVVVDSSDAADGLGQALVDGGLPGVEVTFRTPAAAETIARLSERGDLLVGAGTVLDPAAVATAAEAGARFVVSPGFDRAVVEECRTLGLPVVPGVATPTEIQQALRAGVHIIKLFPAEALGGPAYLRAVVAPFPDLRVVPTGGVSEASLADYLTEPAVVAVGGSWIAPRAAITQGDWDLIRERASAARRIVAITRSARPTTDR